MYLWRNSSGSFVRNFSSKSTWDFLRNSSPLVPWAKVVWFKEEIPRCSFITWLAMLTRLPTKDRLRRWGLAVPADCVLCAQGQETHNHLFFECVFSSELWRTFAQRLGLSQQVDLQLVASEIVANQSLVHSSKGVVARLLFQVCVYLIWKERNKRIFSSTSSPVAAVRSEVSNYLRARLLSFPANSGSNPSLLEVFFSCLPGWL